MFIHRSGAAGPGCSAVSVHAGRHGNAGRRAPGPPHPSRKSAAKCRLQENLSPAVPAASPDLKHEVLNYSNGDAVAAASTDPVHEVRNNSNGDCVPAASTDPVHEVRNNSIGDCVPAASPDPVHEVRNNSNGDCVPAASPDPVHEVRNNSIGDAVAAASPDLIHEVLNHSNGDAAELHHMLPCRSAPPTDRNPAGPICSISGRLCRQKGLDHELPRKIISPVTEIHRSVRTPTN